MTFLELCQELREKCGISGAANTPTTVVGQSGEFGRVVKWINEAWTDVQRAHRWNFRVGNFSFNTVAGTYIYPEANCGLEASTTLSYWMPHTFRRYLTAGGVGGQQYMEQCEYDWFRDVYEFQNGQSGPPDLFTVRKSDRALLLGPNPDGIYTVTGQYMKAATKMTVADASTPTGLPAEFQMLIVYRAMMKYAAYEAAPEVMSEAQSEYKSMMADAQWALLQYDEFDPEPLA